MLSRVAPRRRCGWRNLALGLMLVISITSVRAGPEEHLGPSADYRSQDRLLEAILASAPASVQAYRQQQKALTRIDALLSESDWAAWLATTDSGWAHLVRARRHVRQAWEARGGRWWREVHRDRRVRFRDQLMLAEADFRAATDRLGPTCDLCYAGLIDVLLVLGEREEAAALVGRALRSVPNGGFATPMAYIARSDPRWGGHWDLIESFQREVAELHPRSPAVASLAGLALYLRARQAWDRKEQPRALALAERSVEVDGSSAEAWEFLAFVANASDRPDLALSAGHAALALEPARAGALDSVASVLMRGPEPLQAVPYLERGVQAGSEWALSALLPMVAAGQHGFRADPTRAASLCEAAIGQDMAAGYACMGGLTYFGMGRTQDKPRALGFFMEAADRGFVQAMVDAGQMLAYGDGVPPDRDRAIELWREAHRRGHAQARDKLHGLLGPWGYWWHVSFQAWRQSARDTLAQSSHPTARAITWLVDFVWPRPGSETSG